jgi:hypothetical protein
MVVLGFFGRLFVIFPVMWTEIQTFWGENASELDEVKWAMNVHSLAKPYQT